MGLLLLAGNVQSNPGPSTCSFIQPNATTISLDNFIGLHTPVDGHCLLHAIHQSLAEYLHIDCSFDNIMASIWNELSINSHIYMSFYDGTFTSYSEEITDYFERKICNSNAVDLLSIAAANALKIDIIIITDFSTNFKHCIRYSPGIATATGHPCIVIRLHNQHYSGTKRVRHTSATKESSDNSKDSNTNSQLKTLDKAPYITFPEKKAIQKQPISAPSGKSNQYDSLLGNLRVVHVNIQGLFGNCKMLFGETTGSHSKIDEIRDLQAKPEAPHILCLSETKLLSNIENAEIAVAGYNLVYSDRNRREGGIAIYYSESLNASEDFTAQFSSSIEANVIKLEQHKAKSVNICCIYRPPSSKAAWFDEFNTFFEKLVHLKGHLILAGDFNIDLLKDDTFVSNIYADFELQQVVHKPTRVTNKTSTLIDHMHVSYGYQTCSCKVLNYHLSDHLATLCYSGKPPSTKLYPTHHIVVMHRSTKNTNYDAFKADLRAAPWSIVMAFADADDSLNAFEVLFKKSGTRTPP